MEEKSLKKGINGSLTPGNPFLFGKVPPQAREVEEAILGAIMLNRDAYDLAAEILQPECFYVQSHEKIFRAIKSLAQKNCQIDLLTVVEELRSMEYLDFIGGPYAVTKLTNAVVSSAHIESHCRIVFQKFLQREVIRITGELHYQAYEDSIDAFDLVAAAERSILDIGIKNLKGGMTPISKVMKDALDKIEHWRQLDDSITGIPSGFLELDRATRGWQPGDLIILAARPSVGKTAFALNLIRYAAENERRKVTVSVWSMEMKAVFLAIRMLSAESETLLYYLQTGKLNEQDMQNVVDKINALARLNIFFDENSSITLPELIRKARRLKKQENLGLIVIDYLQLIKGEEKSRGNREQEISKISRDLKNLAQELDVPIIALSQLSREAGSRNVTWDYGPPISAIRESGAIEQDADVIMMLWGPSDEELAKDPSLKNKRKVRIAKQRNGILTTETFNFKNEIQLFQALDKVENTQGGRFIPVAEAFKKIDVPVNAKIDFKDVVDPEDDMPF